MNELEIRWSRRCKRIGLDESSGSGWAQLTDVYATPHRAYHSLEHVSDCLIQLDLWEAEGIDRDSVEMAIWWHDAVYDSRAKDNEEQSALRWRRYSESGRLSSGFSGEVERLIRATDHCVQASDGAGQLIQDIDFSILGRAPEVFDAYEQKIREEYSWVTETAYFEGRSEFLKNLMERERLYLTGFGFESFEIRARSNIERLLSILSDQRVGRK